MSKLCTIVNIMTETRCQVSACLGWPTRSCRADLLMLAFTQVFVFSVRTIRHRLAGVKSWTAGTVFTGRGRRSIEQNHRKVGAIVKSRIRFSWLVVILAVIGILTDGGTVAAEQGITKRPFGKTADGAAVDIYAYQF
jgi:hypothetical protein